MFANRAIQAIMSRCVLKLRIRASEFPKKAQRQLFQAFVQADGSTTRKYGGTGLGLAISKQLVQMMGGEIGIISQPGEGSTFWFTASFEKQAMQNSPVQTDNDVSLESVRLLIVDDSRKNRKIFLHQTHSWGMITAEADTGAVAIEMMRAAAARGEPFEIALLDLMMPEMDGFELARRIKADPIIAETHLILLPSYGKRGDGEQPPKSELRRICKNPFVNLSFTIA